MSNLWGIVQCSMKQFSPEACFLHADIVRMGWKDFFAIEIDRIKQYRPRGVILHCWRGQIPVRGSNGELVPKQSLFMRREMERQPLASRLLARMDEEMYDVVEEMKKYTLVVDYDGPPATGNGMLHAEEYVKEQPTAALMEGLKAELGNVNNFDGYMIDGAGDKDEGSARGRYIEAFDGLFEPRLPTGVEHMAGRNAEHWGDRMSLTLAGIQTGPVSERSGKYDPTLPLVIDEGAPGGRLHRDFAPLARITGEKIVMDNAARITQAERDRRAELIAASGCSPCIPTWSFRVNPYREGFFVPAAPPAPVAPVAVGS